MKIIYITSIVSIVLLYASCATSYENEHQHYLGIKAAMAKDRYSVAAGEIRKFEEKYPESSYLCELLPIQIAWRKDKKLDVDDIEKKYQSKCERRH